jgi:hypothetical protein
MQHRKNFTHKHKLQAASNTSPAATLRPLLLRRSGNSPASNLLIHGQRKVVVNFLALEIFKGTGIAIRNRDPVTSPVHEHLLLPAHRAPQKHLKHPVLRGQSAYLDPAALPLHKSFSGSASSTARNDNTIPTHNFFIYSYCSA